MKSLHILHSEAADGWGGQEIRIFQESLYLAQAGHRVSLVCQPASPLEEQCRRAGQARLQCFPLPMRGAVHITDWLSLRKLIRRLRPDVLHTHSSVDSWLVSFCGKSLGIPIVRSRHVSIPVKNFFPKNWIYSFPARIIASGDAVMNAIAGLNSVSPGRVVSIRAGVDLKRFDAGLSGETIRNELNVRPDQPLIGKVGVVRSWKGYDYFLEAIPQILETVPDARFLMAGGGPSFDRIHRKALDMGLAPVLSILGHREDIPQIMAALDVMVLASTAGEGTPQVIPQAFAMKTPLVATRVGAVADLLDGGQRGILIEKENPQAIAEGVLRLLKDPELAETLKSRAYEFCLQELTFDQMMEHTLRVYREVLEEHRNGTGGR